MSRCLERSAPVALILVLLAAVLAAAGPALAGDAGKGERVFRKCVACHAVGEGARNKVGPELNDLLGRKAGAVADYRYSKAMEQAGADGLVWSVETLDTYLTDPRGFLKGTKMAFAGLKKEAERADLIAYLAKFGDKQAGQADAGGTAQAAEPEAKAAAKAAPAKAAAAVAQPTHGNFHLGRPATAAEIAAWDIDIRPDGAGLPDGRGTVAEGEVLYGEQCASCHGDFGEGRGRWPVLAGGFDTLTRDRPVKTIGSYWPFLSTVYDYVRRAMPFGNARALSDDDVYALTAYLLYLNDIVTDEDFELSKDSFGSVRMPNEGGFIPDGRPAEPAYAKPAEPCMQDCKPAPAHVTMRAQVLDVTPDGGGEEGGAGSVD